MDWKLDPLPAFEDAARVFDALEADDKHTLGEHALAIVLWQLSTRKAALDPQHLAKIEEALGPLTEPRRSETVGALARVVREWELVAGKECRLGTELVAALTEKDWRGAKGDGLLGEINALRAAASTLEGLLRRAQAKPRKRSGKRTRARVGV